ncbi:uncharacterized protein LOC115367374 isoform X1 [Myripristis murdjan]|uniref:uncharacterized protein LOC115367374 isoform X1 n=1 Tax=Myripristis murdjan TaxID=586833 RepID=UPI0011760CD2|nr:uncharacterized protein LOC115367374 isoform X1 [Myripristis murdjan]
MPNVRELRSSVMRRLTAALEKIFGQFERRMAEYEEEVSRSKLEIERQRKLLEAVSKPEEQTLTAVLPVVLLVSEDEVLSEQQEPEPPHIKEEQEELWTSQEGEQLQGVTKFTSVPVKDEDDEEKAPSLQLHQSQTEPMETKADGEDCGGAEPGRNWDPAAAFLQPAGDGQLLCSHSAVCKTEDGEDDYKETREPQSGLDSFSVSSQRKTSFLSESVNRKLSAYVEEILGLFERTIAEYEEEVSRSKLEIERQRKLLEAVSKPEEQTLTAVLPVVLLVSEDEVLSEQQQEEPEDCGGAEPGRNWDPAAAFLQPAGDSQLLCSHSAVCKTEDGEDDCKETREPQSGLDSFSVSSQRKTSFLSESVNRKLSAYVEEILGLFERTIAEYEEEVSRSKLEIERQRKLLEAVSKPEEQTLTAVLPVVLLVSEDEVLSEQQQEEPEDCGGAEPGRNWDPAAAFLQPAGDGQLLCSHSAVCKTEDGEDDYKETREPQSGLDSFSVSSQLKTSFLSESVNRKLSAAVEEILGLFERTIAEFEEEISRSRKNDLQHKLLDAAFQPEVRLHKAVLPLQFPLTPVIAKAEDEEKAPSSQLHQSHTEQSGEAESPTSSSTEPMETETDGEDGGGPEPDRNLDPAAALHPTRDGQLLSSHLSEPETEDGEEDCKETREPPRKKHFQPKMLSFLKVQLHRAVMPQPFLLTSVPVRSEDDEERAQSSQPDQSQTEENAEPRASSSTEHMETEADGAPASPGQVLSSHSSDPETEDSEDDEKETGQPQSGLCSTNEVLFSQGKFDVEEALSSCSFKTATGKKQWRCSVCGRVFDLKGSLRAHIMMHKGDREFSCSVCGKSFLLKGHLKRHMLIHTGEKSHSCSVCGKGFAHGGCLNRHMMTHTGEKPFNCSDCHKGFVRRGDYDNHMRSHTGEKPFSCAICNKRFRRPEHMKRHLLSHTDEKPFSCEVCGLKFKQKYGMVRHVRAHAAQKPVKDI